MFIKLSDFGVVADGVTENSDALRRMRDHILFLQENGEVDFYIQAEPGHYVYLYNGWLQSIKNYTLDGQGAVFQCLNPPAAGIRLITFDFATLFETDGQGTGASAFRQGWKIATVEAGSSSVQLETLDGVAEFVPGGRVALFGYANQGANSYPPAVNRHEYLTIENVDAVTGVVTFTGQLKHGYDDRWTDESQNGLPSFGPGRILPIDRPDFVWPENVVLKNFSTIPNPAFPGDFLSTTGRNVRFENVTTTAIYTSQSERTEIVGCRLERLRFDKMIAQSYVADTDITVDVGDGNDLVVMERCWIGQNGDEVSPAHMLARNLVMRDCHLFSGPTTQFGILKFQEGRYVQRAVLDGNIIHNRSPNLDYVVNNIPIADFTIEEVDAATGDLLFAKNFPNFELTHRRMAPGINLWKDDGNKTGAVLNVVEEGGNKYRVIGCWSSLPVVGEAWSLFTVGDLICNDAESVFIEGKNVPFIRYPLYPPRTGRKLVDLGTVDLPWTSSGYTFPVYGRVTSLNVSVQENTSAFTLRLTINGVVSNIDMSVPGTRRMDIGGVVELGADVLESSWCGQFVPDIALYLQDAVGLEYKPVVQMSCEIASLE